MFAILYTVFPASTTDDQEHLEGTRFCARRQEYNHYILLLLLYWHYDHHGQYFDGQQRYESAHGCSR